MSDLIKPVDPVFKTWREHNYLLRKMISSRIHNHEMFEDALQESYFWVREIVKNFNPDRGVKFKTYFYKAINNRLTEFMKTYNIRTCAKTKVNTNKEYSGLISLEDEDWTYAIPSTPSNLDITLDEYLRNKALRRYISFLTQKQQNAIYSVLSSWRDGGTIKEASIKNDTTIGAFRKNLSQAILRLNKYMKGKCEWMIQ